MTVVAVLGSFHLSVFGFTLEAHQLFKPMLIANGAFWLSVLFAPGSGKEQVEQKLPPPRYSGFLLVAVGTSLAVLLLYAASFQINIHHHDWNHTHISAGLHSLADAARLFTARQADGFYRPLTFLSLWLDYAVFGAKLWGYHIQSIALHIVNSLLVWRLARELRLPGKTAAGAALLFACASVNFEAVLWPAARFDLFATAFALASLICFLRYINDAVPRTATLALAMGFYLLALLNKESAYCVPILAATMALLFKQDASKPISVAKLKLPLVLFAIVTAVMLTVRVAVQRGLGGYLQGTADQSAHFFLSWKTVEMQLTRPIAIPLLTLNTIVPLSAPMKVLLIAFAAALATAVSLGARAGPRERTFVLLAILSALPTLNLIGWIGPPAQHARFFYLPGIWIFLAASSILLRARFGTWIFVVLLAANAAGVLHNLSVYREMIDRASSWASNIRANVGEQKSAKVDLINVPESPFGVYFLSSELVAQVGSTAQVRLIERQGDVHGCGPGQTTSDLVFYWDSAREALAGPFHCDASTSP